MNLIWRHLTWCYTTKYYNCTKHKDSWISLRLCNKEPPQMCTTTGSIYKTSRIVDVNKQVLDMTVFLSIYHKNHYAHCLNVAGIIQEIQFCKWLYATLVAVHLFSRDSGLSNCYAIKKVKVLGLKHKKTFILC